MCCKGEADDQECKKKEDDLAGTLDEARLTAKDGEERKERTLDGG